MHLAKNESPIKINAPGAVARQIPDFGDATGCGTMAGEYMTLAAGTDISPLLKGLEGDLCQSPHWGYVLQGDLTVTYANGSRESVKIGDLFYWPPGHTIKAEADTEFILFSPEKEHVEVLDHVLEKMAG